MLERLYINYRNMDEKDIDIQNFAIEDEKYRVLLFQSFDFDVQGRDEEDIIADYTKTLKSLISSYIKIKDIKKILSTITNSSVQDENITNSLVLSAQSEAKTC